MKVVPHNQIPHFLLEIKSIKKAFPEGIPLLLHGQRRPKVDDFFVAAVSVVKSADVLKEISDGKQT